MSPRNEYQNAEALAKFREQVDKLLAAIPVTLGRDTHLADCNLAHEAGPTGTFACAECGRAMWLHGTRADTCASFQWVTEYTLTDKQIEAVILAPGVPTDLVLACRRARTSEFAGIKREARRIVAGAINAAKRREHETPPEPPSAKVNGAVQDSGGPVSGPDVTLTAPASVMREILRAVVTRARWYETRGYPTPDDTAAALALLCYQLGLDPREV